MIRPERVVLRRLRRLLRPPVAMRLHVGRSDEGDPADDLARGFSQCHHGDALHDARLRPRPPAQSNHRWASRVEEYGRARRGETGGRNPVNPARLDTTESSSPMESVESSKAWI